MTIKELNEKLQLVRQIPQEPNDKLTYALKKLQSLSDKAISPKRAEIQDKITDLQLEYASIDEKGVLVEKDNQYQYSKDNKLKLIQAVRELNKQYDSTTIEFEPFRVSVEQAPRISELDEFLVDEIGDILFIPQSSSNKVTSQSADVPPGKTYPPPPNS